MNYNQNRTQFEFHCPLCAENIALYLYQENCRRPA